MINKYFRPQQTLEVYFMSSWWSSEGIVRNKFLTEAELLVIVARVSRVIVTYFLLKCLPEIL